MKDDSKSFVHKKSEANDDSFTYLHSKCCNAHWELRYEPNGKGVLVCEECGIPAGDSIYVSIDRSVIPPEKRSEEKSNPGDVVKRLLNGEPYIAMVYVSGGKILNSFHIPDDATLVELLESFFDELKEFPSALVKEAYENSWAKGNKRPPF
jgi:hypothetical protein